MMKRSFRVALSKLLVKAVVLVVSQVVVHAGPAKGPGHAQFPAVNLPEVARGQRALQLLGGKLPDVAAAYGWRADELQALLTDDATLAVDVQGRLHYVDTAPQPADFAGDAAPQAANIPLADTFKLHSRAGAKRIVYLDFNGHIISGTGWNTSYNAGRDIIAPAWSIDVDPATFSDAERTIIQQIWRRVAEDYAPFDVDVTTELASEAQITRSSTSDEYYGTRVLISAISSYFGQYGGIAYIGAFDDVGDQYKPALVFPENLGPNGEKYVAEAVSHEAGHNLGLKHDGTTTAGYYQGQGSGVTSWAPIMGAGYYANVTQWSKGEYANANNREDDLAVMETYGLPVSADDHGNTSAAASYFPAGAELSASGVVERSTDVDVFAFTTAAGVISINVRASDLGPNLDVNAELRDAKGAWLASNNPADQLFASLTYTVPAGTYFLHVRGAGLGDPLTTGYSSYGSLGQYWISGTVVNPSGAVAPIANATATPTSGAAPLAVQFDGSESFDQDGSIVSYTWNFGDGTSASGAVVSHTYVAAGSYTATLTVTDNSGLTGTKSMVIQVQGVNAAPVARATATPTSGTAPLVVSLDGRASTDADGTITSYQWNFGDGTSGSGAVVSHTYQAAGTYRATLTVTDNAGATATTAVTIQATPPVVSAIVRVQSITLLVVHQPSGESIRATIKVADANGNAVPGASVSGSFNSVVAGSAAGTTDSSGNAVLTSRRSKKAGTVTFTVNGMSKAGYTYSPSQNLQSTATVVLP